MAEPARHHTIETAAKVLGISQSYLKTLIRKNEIGYLKMGRIYRIRQIDIDAYEERAWHPPKHIGSGPIHDQEDSTFAGQGPRERNVYQLAQKIAAKQSEEKPSTSRA